MSRNIKTLYAFFLSLLFWSSGLIVFFSTVHSLEKGIELALFIFTIGITGICAYIGYICFEKGIELLGERKNTQEDRETWNGGGRTVSMNSLSELK